jgi:succinate dehydrogenase/fumarate reductase flavoprotein subunit
MKNPKTVEKTVDVLVMGGSAGGLPAALRAKEAGAEKVLLIDKRPVLGGCAVGAVGMFAIESPVQKRVGEHHTADDCFSDYIRLQNWRCDARLVRKWFRTSGKVVEWLESKGAHFDDADTFNTFKGIREYHITNWYFTHEGKRMGQMVIDCLASNLRSEGVEIMINTRGTKLLTNKNGDVRGALASDVKNGQEYKINAGAVIIATGSIGGNPELIKKLMPLDDYSNVGIVTGVPHNSGDGYFMAREVGAKQTPVAALRMGPNNHAANPRVNALVRRPEPIAVNKTGERFNNESLYSCESFGWFAGESLDMQPFKTSYLIYDQKILESIVANKKVLFGHETSHADQELPEKEKDNKLAWFDYIISDMDKAGKLGQIGMFKTLDECAKFIGCDKAVFKATVERYNSFCETKYDDDFLKAKEHLIPITTPPFYVVPGLQGVDTFLGGIKVDHSQRVLREDWTPIKGLYGSGTGTGGWINTGYGYPGTCFGYSMYSGYAAGNNAAEYVKSQNISLKK